MGNQFDPGRGCLDEEATAKMLGDLGEGESAEGIPQELAHDLIHLMAHQKMVVETQHILSRCHTDDAMVVVGSDVKLRLDILAIDEAFENALLNHDPNDPSKHFECLLERFDHLVRFVVLTHTPEHANVHTLDVPLPANPFRYTPKTDAAVSLLAPES